MKKHKARKQKTQRKPSDLSGQLRDAIKAFRATKHGGGAEQRSATKLKLAHALAKRDARWQKKLARVAKQRDAARAAAKSEKLERKIARRELKALQRDTKKLLRMLIPSTKVRNETDVASSNTHETPAK